MFHTYFGAFDVVLYLGGTYFAIVLANAIFDERKLRTDRSTAIAPAKTLTPVPVTTSTTTSSPVAPVSKPEEIPVKVPVSG